MLELGYGRGIVGYAAKSNVKLEAATKLERR
jgi:hypothetical protein